MVGNYDYTFDYIFYLDGSIEVKVRLSGYIQGAYWAANQSTEYGYRVNDQFATSIHDHVLNFKADLDIAGTSNTLMRVGIEAASVDYEWDSVNKRPRNTMHLTQQAVEQEAGLDWAANSGEMYILMNQNETNVWGERRGYHIRPGTGMGAPPHLTVRNSTALGQAAGWSTRDLWVVRQKDTEPWSATPYNMLDPLHPPIDFDKFVDGESTEQEDLSVSPSPT